MLKLYIDSGEDCEGSQEPDVSIKIHAENHAQSTRAQQKEKRCNLIQQGIQSCQDALKIDTENNTQTATTELVHRLWR